jgi:phospholipase C
LTLADAARDDRPNSVGEEPVADQSAGADRLRTLKHIVVVMMENRSFDHMLGYLGLEGMTDVDGLTGDEFNLDADGKRVPVHAFDADAHEVQRPGEALQKRLDPDHSPRGVRVQLGPGYTKDGPLNGGFVRSYIESRKPADNVGKDLWPVPMGYYTSKDVPVYDHLARQYCVCDRWYSSIPGDTWPNRLYATAGIDGDRIAPSDLWKQLTGLPPLRRLRSMPLFDVPAFTRHLADRQWRWYAHDPATLRLVDSRYRNLKRPMRENFAFFDRRKVDWLTEALERPIVGGGSFLDDAARGALPQVSWIDPNFVDLSVLETSSNDDHPPSDIRAGQAFVFDVYNALRHSPGWRDTMLVITYDEHGGFYDHVTPPELPTADEARPRFMTYGVRVPALIAGPRVSRAVLHAPPETEADAAQFDHTTLLKTILLAFAKSPDAVLKKMPGRVQRAPHLGSVLLDQPRTDVDDARNARDLIDAWRQQARRSRAAQPLARASAASTHSAAPDGAGQPLVLTDFQADWQKFALVMRRAGMEA